MYSAGSRVEGGAHSSADTMLAGNSSSLASRCIIPGAALPETQHGTRGSRVDMAVETASACTESTTMHLGAATRSACASESPTRFVLTSATIAPLRVIPSHAARYVGQFCMTRQTTSPRDSP